MSKLFQNLMRISLLMVVAQLLVGCAMFRSKKPAMEKVMRKIETPQFIADDLPLETLRNGLEQAAQKLQAREDINNLQFGPLQVSKNAYSRALMTVVEKIDAGADKKEIVQYIRDHFDFYEIYGRSQWGEVFMTSYYDPVILGAKTRTEKYSRPIYGVPNDLVTIDYSAFLEAFPQLDSGDARKEQKSKGSVLRGRLVEDKGFQKTTKVVPYFSREEIDSKEEPVMKTAKILAWVDPIESFFMQIQGSGKIRFEDGSAMRVGYAAQNGHSYVAIGKFLLDIIPKEKMSLQEIEKHLRSVSVEERDRILNLNPSYVFFQELDSKSLTYFGTEVVPGRTIATDRHYFPKGALAYLEFEKPVFADRQTHEPNQWLPTSRFVLDSDTGGAIRGPDRLDLYWGEGDEALQTAGIMKHLGRLTYLVPNEKILNVKIPVKKILQ